MNRYLYTFSHPIGCMDFKVSEMPDYVKKTWFGKNVDLIGQYNYYPPNMTEIDMGEYFRLLRSYCSIADEFRQPMREKDNKINSLRILWYADGTWLAIGYTREGVKFYKGAICVHEMKCDKKLGNCWYRYTCSKCGYQDEIDSSD